jgi:hypothetical protein
LQSIGATSAEITRLASVSQTRIHDFILAHSADTDLAHPPTGRLLKVIPEINALVISLVLGNASYRAGSITEQVQTRTGILFSPSTIRRMLYRARFFWGPRMRSTRLNDA